jgi:hypothetical protein
VECDKNWEPCPILICPYLDFDDANFPLCWLHFQEQAKLSIKIWWDGVIYSYEKISNFCAGLSMENDLAVSSSAGISSEGDGRTERFGMNTHDATFRGKKVD